MNEAVGKPCPPEIPDGCKQKDETENKVLSEGLLVRGLRKCKGFFVGHLRGLYLQGSSPLQGCRGWCYNDTKIIAHRFWVWQTGGVVTYP